MPIDDFPNNDPPDPAQAALELVERLPGQMLDSDAMPTMLLYAGALRLRSTTGCSGRRRRRPRSPGRRG
jgi:hypothetical protein